LSKSGTPEFESGLQWLHARGNQVDWNSGTVFKPPAILAVIGVFWGLLGILAWNEYARSPCGVDIGVSSIFEVKNELTPIIPDTNYSVATG
jgi:hypothetical protein